MDDVVEQILTRTGKDTGPPTQGPSLRRNFSWTFAGNAANMMAQFIMLMSLAQFGDTDMVGEYGLGLALTAPIFLLTGMSLRNVLVTDTANEYAFHEYAVTRFVCYMVGLSILLMVLFIFGYPRHIAMVILLLGVTKVVEGMSDIIHGVFQQDERMDLVAKSMIIKSLITVIAFVGVLAGTGNLPLSLTAVAVVWSVRLLTYDVRNLLRTRLYDATNIYNERLLTSVVLSKRLISRRFWSLLAISMPIGLSSALISLNANIPRYILEWSAGSAALGVFTVLSYPLMAGNVFVSALSQSALPKLSKFHAHSNKAEFDKLLLHLITLAVGCGLIVFLISFVAGEPVLRLLFGAEYSQEQHTFLVLVSGLGVGFVNWFLDTALYSTRAFTFSLGVQIAALIGQTALAFLLIPGAGMKGAAWALVITALAQVILKALFLGQCFQRCSVSRS